MNSIVILGRGQSLKRLVELKESINTVILVNSFWDTIQSDFSYYKDPLIHNFIKDKKIIIIATQFCNIDQIDLFIEKYNVINCFKTNFKNIFRVSKNDKIFKLLPDNLIDEAINIRINFKNIGSIGYAIIYSIHILNIKNIYIFGLDFYEKNYYMQQKHDVTNEINKSELIKEEFIKFFNYNSNIKFNIYSYANIKSNSDNIIIN